MGGLIGGAVQSAGDAAAAGLAQTGFNYASTSPLATVYGPNGVKANNVLSQVLGVTPEGTGGVNGTSAYMGSAPYQFVNASGLKSISPTATPTGQFGGGVIGAPGVASGGAIGKEAGALNTGLVGNNYFGDYINSQMNLANAGNNAYSTITNSTNPSAATNAMLQSANSGSQALSQAVNGVTNYFQGPQSFSPNQVNMAAAIASGAYGDSDVAGQQAGAGGGVF